ncbi:hypothetical protein RhiLY_06661 [Ceratobasidium sp. AG-Ba]|nr:hypothetical protein RhiLY_06661 [Ceratobasidium sp. AG-Ba]
MSKSVPDPNRGTLPKPQPRKLIVCIDGTSNKFSAENTNVVELYNRIRKDETQLTYYNSGIGTYARPFWWSFAYLKQQIMNTVDLAIAWNFEKVVLGAYRWLSDNYRPGDRIFLFGFSRGAYQVRTLAGMIQHVGLIYPGNQEQIPFAWEVYSNNDPQYEKFKETFCRESVDLHFVGVWDTVASVGALLENLFRYRTAANISHTFVTPWHSMNDESSFFPNILKTPVREGKHSSNGGGNKVNATLDRGGEPLKWMMEEAYGRGLSVRMHDVKLGFPHAEVTDSMRKLKWLVLEVLPFLGWRNYLPNGEPRSSWRPHLMRAREVLPYHSIHWTVKSSLEQAKSGDEKNLYSPKAIALEQSNSVTSKEKTKVIQRTWKEMRDAEPMLGRPDWTDDDESLRMMDILLDKNPLDKDQWFKDLCSYALPDKSSADVESPKAAGIWPYGGPRFIQDLFKDYPDKPEIKEIARSIIGFDSALNWNKLPPPPKPTDVIDESSLEQDIKTDLAVRLRDMVIPRVGLLLKQWAKETQKDTHAQVKPGWKGRFLGLFKSQEANTSDDNPVDVNWDWNRIEKENRSMAMAGVAVNVIVDITKSKYSQVLQEASGEIARLVLWAMFELTGRPADVVETASDWKQDKAELAEAILSSMIALFPYDGTKDAFQIDSAGSILHPLVAAGDSHPTLALQAMRTAALLVEDFYCGMDVGRPELILKLAETMCGVWQENEPVKQQLADQALSTMVKLSTHTWCNSQISNQDVLDQIFKLLEDGKYVNDILRVFKNVSADYPENIGTEKIGELVKLMRDNTDASLTLANIASQSADYFGTELFEAYSQAEVAKDIVVLLNHEDDAYIQSVALLLANLINQEGELRKKNEAMERYLVVPEISQALATSLGAPARSQATIDILLRRQSNLRCKLRFRTSYSS